MKLDCHDETMDGLRSMIAKVKYCQSFQVHLFGLLITRLEVTSLPRDILCGRYRITVRCSFSTPSAAAFMPSKHNQSFLPLADAAKKVSHQRKCLRF